MIIQDVPTLFGMVKVRTVKKDDFWAVNSDVIRMIRERFYQEGIQLAAIPKSMDVAEPDNSNGKIPHFVSETSVHRRVGSVSETSEDLVDMIGAEGAEIRSF
jgi:small conductance mechanosensitive channel